jgi:hypothetical protein
MTCESKCRLVATTPDCHMGLIYSIKYMIKALITAVTHMAPLPCKLFFLYHTSYTNIHQARRYVTFKLTYYEDRTPSNYEPAMFHRHDNEDNTWFYSTHDHGEAPERVSFDALNTGFHRYVCSFTCSHAITRSQCQCSDDISDTISSGSG